MIYLFFTLLVSSAAVFSQAAPSVEYSNYAVLQGATNSESTQVAVLHPKTEALTLRLVPVGEKEGITPTESNEVKHEHSNWTVSRGTFGGLALGKSYQLQILNKAGKVVDTRKLQTLDLSSRKIRVAVVSCMDDSFEELQRKMWPQLLEFKPELIFFIGDNVYADKNPVVKLADPKHLWKRYVETRNRLSIFHQETLVPSLALWDDHDMGANDSDRTYPHLKESKEIFETFFPQEEIPGALESGPGVASHFIGFGIDWYLLDGRTFRSPESDKENQTHWGEVQEKWLTEKVNSSKEAKILISGDQFFGGYHPFESFERQHPKRFEWFKSLVRQIKAPVLLVSGDRHLTEIIKVDKLHFGYPTFELTSSGIHAKVFPESLKKDPNPHQLVGKAGVYNYMILDIEPGNPLVVEVQAVGEDKKSIYRRKISVHRP